MDDMFIIPPNDNPGELVHERVIKVSFEIEFLLQEYKPEDPRLIDLTRLSLTEVNFKVLKNYLSGHHIAALCRLMSFYSQTQLPPESIYHAEDGDDLDIDLTEFFTKKQ